jgi:hypothetical protein
MRRVTAGLVLAALGVAGAPGLGAQGAPSILVRDEYALKAQVLVELAAYMRWPEPGRQGRPFILAVVGVSPFGTFLSEYAGRHTVGGRPVEVQYWSWARKDRPCDMLFICRSGQASAPDILEWCSARPVLTACESAKLTQDGVMVGVVLAGSRIRIHLNRQALAAQGFAANAQLLGMATLVGPGQPAAPVKGGS